jgi:phosphoesterase RecJ-like protein
MKRIFESIKEELSRAKTAIVAAHVDPDGDTLGSMIAMALILKKMGIKAVMYSKDGVPRAYRFLPHSDEIYDTPPKYESDLLITVDSSALCRIGDKKILAKKIINIDHHPDNTNFGGINCVELLSAVAEIIYQLALYLEIEIDPEIATALYV